MSKENSGAGSIEIVSNQTPVMTLILLDEPRDVQKEQERQIPDTLASRGFAPDDLIKLLSPDGEPSLDAGEGSSDDKAAASTTLDAAQRAALFGRYVEQVNQRIEQGWERPSTSIASEEFKCQVMIKQDRDGNVHEAKLLACNGDKRWQLSLVRAIERASPLPSPPDRRVFADAITLTFSAQPYSAGGDPDSRAAASAAARFSGE